MGVGKVLDQVNAGRSQKKAAKREPNHTFLSCVHNMCMRTCDMQADVHISDQKISG